MNTQIRYIHRYLESLLQANLNKNKALIIYGPRQAGKTTLLKNLFPENKNNLYLSCDQVRIKEQLIPDPLPLKKIIGDFRNIVLDEAQYLDNPGLIIKILVDNFPGKNFIATGSSSFDLSSKINEPLTGRFFQFILPPLLLSEIFPQIPAVDQKYTLEDSLLYGTYPGVYNIAGRQDKIRKVSTLADSYLYRDILAFNLIKNNQKIRDLLVCIALQIGSQVSYSELAGTLGIDKKTVEHYLDLLEKSFVLFRLRGFSRNLRSEINRKVKIFFYDNGIRNALINNFNPASLRNDGGSLFENFVISEFLKKEANSSQKTNMYFWRTYDQKEVDLVTEKNGKLTAYEIKLTKLKKTSGLISFKNLYPDSKTLLITKDNLFDIFSPLSS